MKNCPLGCVDCDNEVCSCDPDVDEDARVCLHKYEAELIDCIEACDLSDPEWFQNFNLFYKQI